MRTNYNPFQPQLSLGILEMYLRKNYKYYVFEHRDEFKNHVFEVSFFKEKEEAVHEFEMLFLKAKNCKIGKISERDLLEVAAVGHPEFHVYLKDNTVC